MHYFIQNTKPLAIWLIQQSKAWCEALGGARLGQTLGSALGQTMHGALRWVCTMVICLVLTGCAGYTLTADSPSVLGDGSKTIKIKGVENPTLYTNLPYIVRSDLRDELTARNLARWRDEGPTDYTLQIRITRMTIRSWGEIDEDTTTAFTSNMSMEFIVYDGKSNNIVWRSGVQSYTDTVSTTDESSIIEVSSQRLTEKLLDAMRREF